MALGPGPRLPPRNTDNTFTFHHRCNIRVNLATYRDENLIAVPPEGRPPAGTPARPPPPLCRQAPAALCLSSHATHPSPSRHTSALLPSTPDTSCHRPSLTSSGSVHGSAYTQSGILNFHVHEYWPHVKSSVKSIRNFGHSVLVCPGGATARAAVRRTQHFRLGQAQSRSRGRGEARTAAARCSAAFPRQAGPGLVRQGAALPCPPLYRERPASPTHGTTHPRSRQANINIT